MLICLFTCFVGQSMMKKAVLVCFALIVVISVTNAAECIRQKQSKLTHADLMLWFCPFGLYFHNICPFFRLGGLL